MKVKVEELEIEVKRFYVGHEIKIPCPECGKSELSFLGDDYLSYPSLNVEEPAHGYCDECDNEFELGVKLELNIEYDINSVKKL